MHIRIIIISSTLRSLTSNRNMTRIKLVETFSFLIQIMDKIGNLHQVMLERLSVLGRSIYVLNLVNNDFQLIIHRQ